MEECSVHRNMAIPSDSQTAEVLQPGEGSLDRLSPLIPPQFAAVVILLFLMVFSVRAYQRDSASLESFSKGIAVVAVVGVFSRSASIFTRHGKGVDRRLQQRSIPL